MSVFMEDTNKNTSSPESVSASFARVSLKGTYTNNDDEPKMHTVLARNVYRTYDLDKVGRAKVYVCDPGGRHHDSFEVKHSSEEVWRMVDEALKL
jgi:hypothetical protein